MRISVVIPTYARQEPTVRAIRSALAQDAPIEEILVVDDASPEPFVLPADLARDARIRVERLCQNRGESGARNHALEIARGDWIAFLDSDDYWLPGKLRDQVDFIRRDQARFSDALVLYATGFRQHNLNTGKICDRIPIGSDDPLDFASGAWLAQGSTGMFKTSLFRVVGPYDTRLRRLMDLDWLLRMSLCGGKAKVVPVVGAVFEIGGRPSLAAVETACGVMASKYGPGGSQPLAPHAWRHLQAYLDVERAAACRYSARYLAMTGYLLRSVVKVPRLRVSLRDWWRAPS